MFRTQYFVSELFTIPLYILTAIFYEYFHCNWSNKELHWRTDLPSILHDISVPSLLVWSHHATTWWPPHLPVWHNVCSLETISQQTMQPLEENQDLNLVLEDIPAFYKNCKNWTDKVARINLTPSWHKF